MATLINLGKTHPVYITLLTDFGESDYFVASMKGVIYSINPRAVVVDITHNIPSFNIFKAAFTLWATYRYFPRGSIHVVVVDPGVGTARRPIAIRGRGHYFIGPDNGVLSMAAEDDGVVEVREITNRSVMLSDTSSTFHGRDIFAPAAAHLSLGDVSFEDLGPRVEDYVKLSVPSPRALGDYVEAAVVYVDKFGNAFTNIRRGMFNIGYGDLLEVNLPGGVVRVRVLRSYGYAGEGEALALFNSLNLLELAVNRGSFSSIYGVREGDVVRIRVLQRS